MDFIPQKKKFQIIKGDRFLNKKLDILTYRKKQLFKEKINNYDFNYVNEYLIQFKTDFNKIINDEEELKDLLYYGLSKKKNFYIKLSDQDLYLLIDNIHFQDNISIETGDLTKEIIPRMLLIKDNKFTKKTLKVFEEIFNSFSKKGKMTKIQIKNFINKTFDENFKLDDKNISHLFSSYLSNDGFLGLKGFYKFYKLIIQSNTQKNALEEMWKHLNNLGYNNMLEKKNYDLNYVQVYPKEFEEINENLKNYFKILNRKINKLSLGLYVDKIFIQNLNQNNVFRNIKVIEISTSNFHKLIKLSIKFENVEELSFKINKDLKKNINEINNLFPNIKSLNLYIYINFDLINLLRNLTTSKIEDLKIFFLIYYEKYNNNLKNKLIILDKIINLKIDINKDYDYINEIFYDIFINIQFPNLKEYQLSFNMNNFGNNKRIKKMLTDDYNYINIFIIDTLIFKKEFSLKSFFELPNKLKNINYLYLNFENFKFSYQRKKDEKYFFKFIINNEIEFKNYYFNYNLLIDDKEIIKYKKIDIKGLNKINKDINNIEAIIEKKEINLCDINLNIDLKTYYINSFNNIKSIYCENEIQKTNLKELIKKKELKNLKYINIRIGYIKGLYKEMYLYDKYIFDLIKNSKNLKSLILRIDSNNFNKNIKFILDLIKDLNKLRIVNIYSSDFKFETPLEQLIEEFPVLKNRIYYFKEFKINNIGFEMKINNIVEKNRELINTIKCNYDIKEINKPIQIINNKNNEGSNIKKYCTLFLNNEKIEFNLTHIFPNIKKYDIKFRFLKYLNDMSYMFSDCSSLSSLDLSNLNTINVNDMKYMLSNCISLTSLDLSNFNTINVNDMSYMFSDCRSLTNLNLTNFKTINVNNMSFMFSKCSSLTSLDLSNFNTTNVKDMKHMFSTCSSLNSLEISKFNTEIIISMNHMFYKCCSLVSIDLLNFNTINVKDMSFMFSDCSSLKSLKVSKFNTINVISMSYMFSNCSSLISLDLSNFNTSNVKDMNSMFSNCSLLNSLDLSNFDTSKVNNMRCMFSNCISLNYLNLSKFNVINVKYLDNIFSKLSENCKIKTNDELLLNQLKNI